VVIVGQNLGQEIYLEDLRGRLVTGFPAPENKRRCRFAIQKYRYRVSISEDSDEN